jgi:hypothetical protein
MTTTPSRPNFSELHINLKIKLNDLQEKYLSQETMALLNNADYVSLDSLYESLRDNLKLLHHLETNPFNFMQEYSFGIFQIQLNFFTQMIKVFFPGNDTTEGFKVPPPPLTLHLKNLTGYINEAIQILETVLALFEGRSSVDTIVGELKQCVTNLRNLSQEVKVFRLNCNFPEPSHQEKFKTYASKFIEELTDSLDILNDLNDKEELFSNDQHLKVRKSLETVFSMLNQLAPQSSDTKTAKSSRTGFFYENSKMENITTRLNIIVQEIARGQNIDLVISNLEKIRVDLQKILNKQTLQNDPSQQQTQQSLTATAKMRVWETPNRQVNEETSARASMEATPC